MAWSMIPPTTGPHQTHTQQWELVATVRQAGVVVRTAEERLGRNGVKYSLDESPAGLVQLFVVDPAGNGVELNFQQRD